LGGALFGLANGIRCTRLRLADQRSRALVDGHALGTRIRELALELDEALALAGEPLFDVAQIPGECTQVCFEPQAAIFRSANGAGAARDGRSGRGGLRGLRIERGHVPRVGAAGAIFCDRSLIRSNVEHGQLGSNLEIRILRRNRLALHAHARVPLCSYGGNITRDFDGRGRTTSKL
jgi:hypothetical protein